MNDMRKLIEAVESAQGDEVEITGFSGPNQFGEFQVRHNCTWDVYNDDDFKDAARKYTGIPDLEFTEDGMQDDDVASMESNFVKRIQQGTLGDT